jgi:very-short-patch-repair endonuclease
VRGGRDINKKPRSLLRPERPGWSTCEQVAFQVTMSERRTGTYNTAKPKEFRKKLRNSVTAAECVLSECVKNRQLIGKKFRRQVGIGRYTVDLYVPAARLVVELDGTRHFSITMDDYEAENELSGAGRLNKKIYDHLEGALDTIKQALDVRRHR